MIDTFQFLEWFILGGKGIEILAFKPLPINYQWEIRNENPSFSFSIIYVHFKEKFVITWGILFFYNKNFDRRDQTVINTTWKRK